MSAARGGLALGPAAAARAWPAGASHGLPSSAAALQYVAMTGELSPADPGELRASHEDRDRVAEQLRVAAGDGRLTGAELDERLELALTARTYRELAALVADLPVAA